MKRFKKKNKIKQNKRFNKINKIKRKKSKNKVLYKSTLFFYKKKYYNYIL